MRHHLTITTMSSKTPNPKKTRSNPNPNPNPNCQHSTSATLDLLILLLVLFSGTFLISSYFSYTLHSLSLLLPSLSPISLPLSLSLLFLFLSTTCFFVFRKRRKCGSVGCKGLRNALEIDLRLQSEECLREGGKGVKEVDNLPWKGGGEGKEFECLRNELRKMAPVNGRAVLVFQNKCGCAVAKMEGWSLKRGRKNKKALALKGGGDHRYICSDFQWHC